MRDGRRPWYPASLVRHPRETVAFVADRSAVACVIAVRGARTAMTQATAAGPGQSDGLIRSYPDRVIDAGLVRTLPERRYAIAIAGRGGVARSARRRSLARLLFHRLTRQVPMTITIASACPPMVSAEL